MKSSLAILGCFAFGVLTGRHASFPAGYDPETLSLWLVYLLLVLIGLSAGSDTRAWTVLRSGGLRVLVIPGSAVLGSFVAAILIGFALKEWTHRELLAVGFGFGYYSLSSILIEQIHSGELALVALLSNVFREFTTVVAAVPLTRVFGPLAPIVSGGVTSSDVTLPAIVHASGREYTVIAIFNGMALTLLVPILIPLILSQNR